MHAFAQRWTWFLRLFEERIPQLFGRVKGGRKQLGTRVIKAASDRARELCPVGPGDAEPTILDDLENLWQAGERDRVARSVWVLSCLEDADSRLIVSPWLMEPEIEDLVGDAVRRARSGWNPERGDLVERLVHEPGGPNLERLAARAEGVCAALEKDIGDAWGRLRKHVSAHDAYHPVAEVLSYLIFDLDSCTDDLEEMETARQEALARCRHCELRSLLEGTLDALPETRFADEADALRGRVATLLEGSGLPLCFPEPEWERCRGLAERFRAGIVEPGEHERALQEASRRYAENPSAANLGALHAAAAAEREQPRSTEPAAALDGIAACLGDLVERFGSLADRDGEEEEIAGREPRDPERALQAEIGELKAANREAGSGLRRWCRPSGMPPRKMTTCGARSTGCSRGSRRPRAASLRRRKTGPCLPSRATRSFRPGRSGISGGGCRSRAARCGRSRAPNSRTWTSSARPSRCSAEPTGG